MLMALWVLYSTARILWPGELLARDELFATAVMEVPAFIFRKVLRS